MNNEKMNQMIGEAYENYRKSHTSPPSNPGGPLLSDNLISMRPIKYTREEFINKCKTDPEFSETWGLKIVERELSLEEKEWQLEKTNCINDIENDRILYGHEWEKYIQEQYEGIQSTQGIKIPTKLITITYKNQKTESYE
jgi:hypothetical protein